MDLLPLVPLPILFRPCFLLALPLIQFVNKVNPTFRQRLLQKHNKGLPPRPSQARSKGWLLHVASSRVTAPRAARFRNPSFAREVAGRSLYLTHPANPGAGRGPVGHSRKVGSDCKYVSRLRSRI